MTSSEGLKRQHSMANGRCVGCGMTLREIATKGSARCASPQKSGTSHRVTDFGKALHEALVNSKGPLPIPRLSQPRRSPVRRAAAAAGKSARTPSAAAAAPAGSMPPTAQASIPASQSRRCSHQPGQHFPSRSDYWPELKRAARDSSLSLVGRADAKDLAHRRVVTALLDAFRKGPADGVLYVEPSVREERDLPPDALLLHPDVGVLVIEVKAWSVTSIERVVAGNFLTRIAGLIVEKNPFEQVRRSMFNIKNAVERLPSMRGQHPLFIYAVAFPNICDQEWRASGFDEAVGADEVFLATDLESPTRLRARIGELVTRELADRRIRATITQEQVVAVRAALGDSAVLRDLRTPRAALLKETLGAHLDELALSERSLSREQMDLSRLEVGGHPRLIRGVAGSGKSIVLASMVARYVNRRLNGDLDLFRDAPKTVRVGVVCFNRALVPFILKKVQESYWEQTRAELPSGIVEVTHLNGLMWSLKEQGVQYVSVGIPASERAQRYSEQLTRLKEKDPERFSQLEYDVLFVDEGQDLVPEEYRLLLQLTHSSPPRDERPLVIFYDDAQNVYGNPRPVWSEIGIDVQRGDRTRVMKECFRNTRPIVELAFNILLGSHALKPREVGTRSFAEAAYLGDKGLVSEEGGVFRVHFAERAGPPPEVRSFRDRHAEVAWVAGRIAELIKHDEVRPEDILVLAEHGNLVEELESALRKLLPKGQLAGYIKPFGDKSDDKDRYIFRERHLTLSTTRGAKGYDAFVGFLLGADEFAPTLQGRASFYVGATRAKYMLTVTGLEGGELLQEAFAQVGNLPSQTNAHSGGRTLRAHA